MKTGSLSPRPRRPGIGPIALILVASIQWILVSTSDISPWIGGGYGMFAVVDGPHRKLVALGSDNSSVVGDVAVRQAPFSWSLEGVRERFDADRVLVLRPAFDASDSSVSWAPLVEWDGDRD